MKIEITGYGSMGRMFVEKFPEIAGQLFEKTLEKRRQTTLKAEELF